MGYSGGEPGLDRGFRPSIAIAIALAVMAFLFYHYRKPVMHVVLLTFTLCLVVLSVCALTYLICLVLGWHRKPPEAPRRASQERVTPVVDVAAADMEATAETLADPGTQLAALPGELPSPERDSTSGPAALPSAEPDAER